MTKTELDYTSAGTNLPENSYGISPSQLVNFINTPWNWYREQILGEPSSFTGNTSSFLGTVVHYVASSYALHRSVNKSEIFRYLYNHLVSDKDIPPPDFNNEDESVAFLYDNADHPEIDCTVILDKYKDMGNNLIRYINSTGIPQRVEDTVIANVARNVYVAGTADAVIGDMLRDYKTTSTTSPKEYIPYDYKLQLMTYAYAYRKQGIPINRIQIVWITQPDVGRVSEKTGKPLKDYPCQVIPVTYVVTQEDWDYIDSVMNLVADTIKAHEDHPELTHVIWRDYRLKPVETKGTIFATERNTNGS